MTIAAILLAAGFSRRFGAANKLLAAAADGRPMVRHTAGHILQSMARPLVVVLGHEAPAVQACLQDLDLSFVLAADYAEGIAASVRAGVAALPAGCTGVLICLGDMPLVTPQTLNALIVTAQTAPSPSIVAPTHAGHRGNPVVWPRAFFPDLLALTGDRGGSALIAAKYPDKLLALEVSDPGVLADFDFTGDWARGSYTNGPKC